ncbi:hypothetical protein F511_22544 [Dorcoceras hygrometricum]|uniref:Uncharacterized protein n=1 Tax=Dorcoceras hygrometricum TaxID=472368 RepID=A0A2Z7BUL4_9LAMI|nr:hypothetical protein F511_22544 [Dorcoceras hygrometricum]
MAARSIHVAPESGAYISMDRPPCCTASVQRPSIDRSTMREGGSERSATHCATAREATAKILGRPSFKVAAQRRLPCVASAQAARSVFLGVLPCWRLGAWLRPVSRGNRRFTVGGGRLRQSGPRPEGRLLRQPALEGLTRSARTYSPRKVGRSKSGEATAAACTGGEALEEKGGGGGRSLGARYLCDPQWFRDTASRGPTTIVAPESQFRTCASDHDNIGYPRMSASGESSTTMHRLLHASGCHPIPPPNDPKGVSKRVKVRRLSCRVSMTFRVLRTNQYNQDLGLIHSTNGNHLESPNEGSSIDHQVIIYLHAQNITMFPTNETWYFASQILFSSSGDLILILTVQSTRN